MRGALKRLVTKFAAVAAVAFYWGAAEAAFNHLLPPKGTWKPDRLWTSVYDRVLFYALAVGVAAFIFWCGRRLLALGRRDRPRAPGARPWAAAAALGAIIAANAGWLVLGAVKSYDLEIGPLSLDMQRARVFFGYWAFFAAVGVGVTFAAAFALAGRRRAGRVAAYLKASGAAAFVAVAVIFHAARALRPRPDGPNVVLVVLDAWRGDTFRPDLMPRLYDHAAKRGLVFERTWTTATWTMPAMATIFTGQYPHTHNTRQNPRPGVYAPTLAQTFRVAGYDTVAFSANRILDRNTSLADGFDDFYFTDWVPLVRATGFYYTNWYGPAVRHLIHAPPTSEDTRILTRWLDRFTARPRRRPYFLWVHYMDPHGPYIPPPGYYLPSDEKYIRDYRPYRMTHREALKRLYDGECRFMDDQLSTIIPRLTADDRMLVVITGDHGEEFWEHGKLAYGHGKSAYDTLTRVPLIIYVPGARPARTDALTGLVALAPTILTLAGLKAMPTMEGRPFLTASGKPVPGRRPVFIGSSFFRLPGGVPERRDAVVDWPYKLILYHYRLAAPGEYYDLAGDPGEEKPLPENANAARLRGEIYRWRSAAAARKSVALADETGAAPVDLKALGYIK